MDRALGAMRISSFRSDITDISCCSLAFARSMDLLCADPCSSEATLPKLASRLTPPPTLGSELVLPPVLRPAASALIPLRLNARGRL